MHRFGYKDVYEELKAANSEPNFDRLENIMTLNPDVRDFFDNMLLWFEEVKGEVKSYYYISSFPYVQHRLHRALETAITLFSRRNSATKTCAFQKGYSSSRIMDSLCQILGISRSMPLVVVSHIHPAPQNSSTPSSVTWRSSPY